MSALVPFPDRAAARDVAALVDRAQHGDRAAFSELYARFSRMVHGVLLARVHPSVVEDLVQDVFMAALQKIDSLTEPAAFGGWLAAIARNRATDHVRRTPMMTELPDTLASRDVDPTDALAVLGVMQALPEAYRETLTLRLVEGLTGPEIAAMTGLTEGSVRVNLHRGMKQLRERLVARRPL